MDLEDDLGVPFIARAAAMTWFAAGALEILLAVQNLLMPWAGSWQFISDVILAVGVGTLFLAYSVMRLRPWTVRVGVIAGGLVALGMTAWVICSFVIFGFFSLLALFAAIAAIGAFITSLVGLESMLKVLKKRQKLRAEGIDFGF